jgi:hypothetical protein
MACSEASFVKAMERLMGFFYIFNIAYPKQASLTYEFMQRMLLRIRIGGTRGHKNGAASMAAVLQLICDVKDKIVES